MTLLRELTRIPGLWRSPSRATSDGPIGQLAVDNRDTLFLDDAFDVYGLALYRADPIQARGSGGIRSRPRARCAAERQLPRATVCRSPCQTPRNRSAPAYPPHAFLAPGDLDTVADPPQQDIGKTSGTHWRITRTSCNGPAILCGSSLLYPRSDSEKSKWSGMPSARVCPHEISTRSRTRLSTTLKQPVFTLHRESRASGTTSAKHSPSGTPVECCPRSPMAENGWPASTPIRYCLRSLEGVLREAGDSSSGEPLHQRKKVPMDRLGPFAALVVSTQIATLDHHHARSIPVRPDVTPTYALLMSHLRRSRSGTRTHPTGYPCQRSAAC